MDAQSPLGTELALCFLQKSLFIAVARTRAPLRDDALFADPPDPQAAVGSWSPSSPLAERLGRAAFVMCITRNDAPRLRPRHSLFLLVNPHCSPHRTEHTDDRAQSHR